VVSCRASLLDRPFQTAACLEQFERVIAKTFWLFQNLSVQKRLPLMLPLSLIADRSLRARLTLRTRSVLDAILLSEGSIGSAEHVATRLGLENRFQLARLLKREGLPPLHRLAEWATVLSWVIAAEERGVSLCYLAFRSRRHPSACYRLVKEITGMCWAEVRARGSRWLQRAFVKRFSVLS
jgi:hypothetical protein